MREKVTHVLIVDLEVGDMDAVGGIGAGLVVDAVEQGLAGAGDEAGLFGGAHHGVTLAGTRLAIGENAGVITFKVVVEELLAKGAVDVLLVSVVGVVQVVGPERLVEDERLFFVDPAAVCARVGGR